MIWKAKPVFQSMLVPLYLLPIEGSGIRAIGFRSDRAVPVGGVSTHSAYSIALFQFRGLCPHRLPLIFYQAKILTMLHLVI